jgi:uncharacterized RmlC-like cupin family protein
MKPSSPTQTTYPTGNSDYCVMIGAIPPGVSVPLHSHPDPESFIFSPALCGRSISKEIPWNGEPLTPGDFAHIPGHAKHAWQNASSEPSLQLITTTRRLGRFSREIGRPVSAGSPGKPPTPDDFQHLIRIAARYEYWMGSAEENAALRIVIK